MRTRDAPTLQDGRDVPDGTSIGFVEQLEKDLAELQAAGVDAKIASGGGRMAVTMDRYEVETQPASAWYLHNACRSHHKAAEKDG